ncbi:MAG: potassium channel protein [Dermatophilaceae bacterium]
MLPVRRLVVALSALVAVTLFGTVGYLLLGFTVMEALYQTVTTVATVGFREVRPLDTRGEVFTIVLIVFGVGTTLYNLTVMLEVITEGHVRRYFERRRMDKRIAAMSSHVIICGLGRVGRSARDHLLATGAQVVVVDIDADKLEGLSLPHLVGDVTRDEVLRAAGIERARALIATLETDADTVYLTLSARAIRPDMVIIARARTADSKEKLVLAGATRAVNPQMIGGRRIAAFALHAHVAEFLDVVMHDAELDFRIQQVRVTAASPLVDHTLGEVDLEELTGARLLAFRAGHGMPFTPNPLPGTVLTTGSVLIAFGTLAQIESLGQAVGIPADEQVPRQIGDLRRPAGPTAMGAGGPAGPSAPIGTLGRGAPRAAPPRTDVRG